TVATVPPADMRVCEMAFGKHRDTGDVHEPADDVTAGNDVDDVDELDGPFDIDDFDDPSTATLGRLDLGSVLIPMPEAGQVQVELSEMGIPSAVWVVTPNGRFTIAAYAAPKTSGLWRDVASELADSLRKDVPKVGIEDGPWGREVVGVSNAEQGQPSGVVRFIGIDGYRWMIRCVVNGPQDKIVPLAAEARDALADTVVRRGETPLPVRTPLQVQLPGGGATPPPRPAPRYGCSCRSRWPRNCARPRNRPLSSRRSRRCRLSNSRSRPSLSHAAASLGPPCSSCGPSRAASDFGAVTDAERPYARRNRD